MFSNTLRLLFCKASILYVLIISNPAIAQPSSGNPLLDIQKYEVNIEPNLDKHTIKGDVKIYFKMDTSSSDLVIFDKGELIITEVIGNEVKSYKIKGNKLFVQLDYQPNQEHEIQVFYKGAPKIGLIFSNTHTEVYTLFNTSEWMVCNKAPNDRAKLNINLIIPNDKACVASGTFIGKKITGSKTIHSWTQEYETPAYTYGFTIGIFNSTTQHFNGIELNYFSSSHTMEELLIIFDKSSDMLQFFEEKSGVKYEQNSYSQILIGNHYQEMSGFSVLKSSYGNQVLNDSTETNLISHELAHQWWGNMITCDNWNHFWLNEGIVTYMSAAYNEHRFGKEAYNNNINVYFNVYQKIKNEGQDKSLVFNNWENPTKKDRNLVYFKGAYVIHLLRMEIGDDDFWKGIKQYSTKYYGKSVTTNGFQQVMENVSNKNLSKFFNQWVY